MSSEEERVSSVPLNEELIRSGLGVIGKHPVLLNHTYLELKIIDANLEDVSLLSSYPNLMYLNLSKNSIENVLVLKELPTLVQLNLSNNKITECLDFTLDLCNKDKKWSQGDTSIGSMLTNVNLGFNNISTLNSLAHHPFLEVLMLNNNNIVDINGLSSLKFLRVLDLSNNSIKTTIGLDSLQIQELNLSGNCIADLSLLDTCPKLSSLDVSNNNIRTLSPLLKCGQLMWLNASNNQIELIRQCDFLSELNWLNTLLLSGNPCSLKQFYRRRVIGKLPKLFKLDASDVTPEEKIETANLLGGELSDVQGRKTIFHKHFPKMQFTGPSLFLDDEINISNEEIMRI
jgi:Leucine-rich repeat (LRR) protein